MEVLLNPNVGYILLVLGVSLAIMATFVPGTGILELGAVILLLLAGVYMVVLPVNYWALGLLILGIVPFIFAVRRSDKYIYLILSIAAIVIGSTFLFKGVGGLTAVNPFLALIVSTIMVLYFWFVGRKMQEVLRITPTHDINRLVGQVGMAKTDIQEEGSVQIAGELWSGHSQRLITSGSQVRVISVDGLILTVEPVQPNGARSGSLNEPDGEHFRLIDEEQ